jgi:aryl-alcohol dehydrogenase-like predicted oxidoreductase
MNSPQAIAATRRLGAAAPLLPALGFGCMGLVGWYGERDDEEARATVLEAIERGVVHLDTAASYQNGANERFVGASIRAALSSLGVQRRALFIATKYGLTRAAGGELTVDNSPASLRAACDLSLDNLGCDYIDLFYLHRIDPQVPIEDSIGALQSLVQAGKIRHVGLSECSVPTLRRAHAIHPIAAVQSEYSLWAREPEQGMLQACRELAVGFVAYSPLGRGFLAGNFRSVEELPVNDVRRQQPRMQGDNGAHNLQLTAAIRAFAERKACSAAQLALAWVLAGAEQPIAIPGMKRRSHLRDNLGALALQLSAAERAELSLIAERCGVRGDRHPPAMMQVLDR